VRAAWLRRLRIGVVGLRVVLVACLSRGVAAKRCAVGKTKRPSPFRAMVGVEGFSFASSRSDSVTGHARPKARHAHENSTLSDERHEATSPALARRLATPVVAASAHGRECDPSYSRRDRRQAQRLRPGPGVRRIRPGNARKGPLRPGSRETAFPGPRPRADLRHQPARRGAVPRRQHDQPSPTRRASTSTACSCTRGPTRS
jgi:hypothetical protein